MGSLATEASGLSAATLFGVNGLVALVTGGATGIGLMCTKALLQNGASKVYIVGRRPQILEETAASLGSRVVPIQGDVCSKADLQRVADYVEKDAGFLNLLVCNAGIGGPQVKPITEETTVDQWAQNNFDVDFDDYTKTFAVNSAAVWFTSMALLTLLDKGNKKGNVSQTSQIIVTCSIAGFNKKAPGGWAYGQSKAAATLATKQLAVALPKWNIRANGIAPGLFPSEMSEPIVQLYSGSDQSSVGLPKEMIPLGRMGNEEEMSGTFLYLASQAGGYCNGAIITIDGGRLGTFPSTS